MPSYVFDLDILEQRIKFLKENLGVELCYAMKANPFIVEHVASLVSRIECCSPGELAIARRIKEDKIVISGVYKDCDTVKKGRGIFTIESRSHLTLIKKYHQEAKLLLRLTSGNQFGMDLEEVLSILKELKDTPYKVVGIQYYSGTQKRSIERLKKEIEYLDNLLLELKKEYPLEELEYGPGLPVSYFDEDFDEVAFLSELKELLKLKSKVKVYLELGRSIAASCGTYKTKVVDKKTNANSTYVLVDGGIHHLVYYGQFMATKIPEVEVSSIRELEKVTIVGSLCTVNDILLKQVELPSLEVGDTLTFKNTGAYSMCEGISLFLSRDLPEVYLKKNNELKLVRESFKTYILNEGVK